MESLQSKSGELFPCLCCGYRTLQDVQSFEICPVCGWEDTPEGNGHITTASDGCTPFDDRLLEAQDTFARLGACDASWVDMVRQPAVGENRTASWMTIRDRRSNAQQTLVPRVEEVFAGVTRDGGISLHQLDLLDSLIGAHADDLAHAEKSDPELHWQEIADEKLRSVLPFPFGLFFLDAKGFRFYIPAYIRLLVRAWGEGSRAFLIDNPWSIFEGTAYHQETHYALLTDAQRRVIAEFLVAARECGYPEERKYATRYLLSYWHTYS